MLTVQETLDQVAKVHSDMPFQKHPLWDGLAKGTWSRPQVQEFARQFGIIPLHNHNYHGRLYVICPHPGWRAKIAEVVYEEGTGRLFSEGIPHNTLYLNFGRGLGMSDDELWNAHYCPEALAFKSYFQDICGRNIVEGIASHMLAGEAQGPGFFSKMAQQMKKSYDLDDKTVAFWVIHDEADGEHSSVGVDLLADFAKTEEERRLVIKTVRETVEMTFLLYDGILRNVQKLA
jgi:pyrroloquinoline-quinone synthase